MLPPLVNEAVAMSEEIERGSRERYFGLKAHGGSEVGFGEGKSDHTTQRDLRIERPPCQAALRNSASGAQFEPCRQSGAGPCHNGMPSVVARDRRRPAPHPLQTSKLT